MKRFLLILAVCLTALSSSYGQGKLQESSSEKRPVWVKKDPGSAYLMKVRGESTVSINSARDAAFDKLHDIVVSSVTKYLLGINFQGRDVNDILEAVENTDFVRNISEWTAVETYWEHRVIKKQDVYLYYILYDFNDFEKKKIAFEVDNIL
ncbi:MAG TPA: hypothetical protein IAC04_05140 [Candidatus Coprenecus stercoravium]|uniref:Lipoprotein n=1 Tax=Candidatus Coprenecus stercoravium TaxID=2840735 RepID=A0A9D2GRE9_9BACT|nr:hypothetical protein [Candidatus Coprenecus stercoravium]